MPRYSFEISDDRHITRRIEHDLPDIRAVRRKAVEIAADLMREAPDLLWDDGDLTIAVRDEKDLALLSVVVGMVSPAMRLSP